jgi:lipoate-protein ligase A
MTQPSLRWQVCDDGAQEGALNMARDHALAVSAEPGRALLRFYGWREPTLSFGRNEPAEGRWQADRLRGAGFSIVRRPTGGRAVLHRRELTYAVVVHRADVQGARDLYQRINLGLARALQSLGVPAVVAEARGTATSAVDGSERTLASDARVLPVDAGPCFEAPAPGEVTVMGRKLVGSAQARIEQAFLQHGSILLHDDQGLIDPFRSDHGAAVESGAGGISLAELLTRVPDRATLARVFSDGLRDEFEVESWDQVATLPGAGGIMEAEWLRHYQTDAWTWRR